MSKKGPVIILSILIGLIILVILYFSILRAPREISAAMKAVSKNTAVLIELKHYYKWSENLREHNDYWQELIKQDDFKNLHSKLSNLDSTFSSIPELDVLIEKKPMLIALSVIGKSSIEPTYIIETDELTSEEKAHELIAKHLKNKADITSKPYQDSKIFSIKFKNRSQENCSYAFYKGLWLCSPSVILVEEAIRQIDEPLSITDDPDFKKVHKTSGHNVDMNIYIQYKTFAKLFSKYINPSLQKSFQNISYFADWSELDLNFEKSGLFFNGFTNSNEQKNNYLNIFRGQSSGTNRLYEILPSNTSNILSFYISDFEKFENNQVEYFDKKGKKEQHLAWFKDFENKFQFDLKSALLEIIEHEIGIVYTLVNPLDLSQNTYFVVETEGESQTMDEFMPLLENWAHQKQVETSSFIYKYEVKDQKTTLIYRFPRSDLASKWLGRFFKDSKTNYFTFIDDYMVFGNTIKDLKQIIDNNDRKSVLENDSYFKELQGDLSSESNISFYSNMAQAKPMVDAIFSSSVSQKYKANFESFKKFQAFALQINSSEDLFYVNCYLKYNPVIKEKPRTVWESKLDTSLSIKPKIVINHRNNQKEIFVQDLNHTIYLIDRHGKILWRQNIGEKIESEIHQIDYYKNNKLQYLFNTKNKIHILDRNGNNVEQYPLMLRAPATAGIAVFDYDGSRDYRFFIPCKDKKIYVYNIEGKILPGWEFQQTQAEIKTEIQHFRLKDIDYILASDKNRIYILNRRGEEKVITTQHVQKSLYNPFFLVYKDNIPYFSGTTPSGQIFMINEKGNVFMKDGLKVSKNHRVLFKYLNENSSFDLIYSDQGEMKILYDLSKTVSHDFDGNISKAIPFEFSSKNIKIGLTDYTQNDLYLFNNNGTIYKDFPLKGSSMFSISLFNNAGHKFNLITGSKDGFLYNYEVP